MKAFRAAFGNRLVDQIPPGIVPVAVPLILGFVVHGRCRAVGPGVLG